MVSSGLLRRVALVRTDVFLRSVRQLLVVACVVPSSPIFVTLMEAPGSSETSVLTRATRHNNPEDTILHNHRRENLKSYRNISDPPVMSGRSCRRSLRRSPSPVAGTRSCDAFLWPPTDPVQEDKDHMQWLC
jgi:hypothetical protein